MSNWYETGDSADQKVQVEDQARQARQAEAEERRKNAIYRFRMPKDTQQHITFLDDVKSPHGFNTPFVFMEHNLQLNGRWGNHFTCVEGVPHPETGKKQKCPICATGDSTPSLVAVYTVIDHNEWTSKKTGHVHKDEPKLYVCKTAVQKTLRHAAQKRGGSLAGWKVEVSRGSDSMSPNTGSNFDFEEKTDTYINPESEFFVELKDYRELFKPKTEEELAKLIGGVPDDVAGDDEQVRF